MTGNDTTRGRATPARAPDELTRRGRRTRTALIEAARTVFSRKGYFETRLTDITEEAGVATGTFYTYFEGKNEILSAVFAELESEMLHPPTSEPAGVGLASSIEAANRAYMLTYKRHAGLMRTLEQAVAADDQFIEVRRHRDQAFQTRNSRLISRLQDLGVADRSLDPVSASRALSGMVGRIAYYAIIVDREESLEPLIDTVTQLWLNGLGISESDRDRDLGTALHQVL